MKSRVSVIGGLLVLFLGSLTLYWASIINGPNFDLSFSREIRSKVDQATLGQALSMVENWPKWFFSTTEAKVVDGTGQDLPAANQVPVKGAWVRIQIDPKKGQWRRFEILAQIADYVPDKALELRILKDSSGKLFRMFDRLQWRVEIIPRGNEVFIHGSASAHTAHWRSRLFGRLAERIVMYQVYYMDLLKLAGIKSQEMANPMFPPGSQ